MRRAIRTLAANFRRDFLRFEAAPIAFIGWTPTAANGAVNQARNAINNIGGSMAMARRDRFRISTLTSTTRPFARISSFYLYARAPRLFSPFPSPPRFYRDAMYVLSTARTRGARLANGTNGRCSPRAALHDHHPLTLIRQRLHRVVRARLE